MSSSSGSFASVSILWIVGFFGVFSGAFSFGRIRWISAPCAQRFFTRCVMWMSMPPVIFLSKPQPAISIFMGIGWGVIYIKWSVYRWFRSVGDVR